MTSVLDAEVQAAAELLRADGGDLVLVDSADGVLTLRLELRDASCADCVMPAPFIERIVASRLTAAGVPFDRVAVLDPRAGDPSILELASEDPIEVMDELERLGWGDGLPVVVPTPSRVEEALAFLPGDPDEILAVLPPRYGAVTRRVIAANTVMAGCPPAAAPVVLAAALALSRPEVNLRGVNATTHPVSPLTIVHGSVVSSVGFNSGRNAFGPGNRANATVGRAVRLVLIHVSGARAGISDGVGDASTQGQPSKYSYCVAENEAASPWGSYSRARGCSAASAVTVHCGENPHNVHDMESTSPEPILAKVASVMTTLGANNACISQGEYFVLLCPEHAATIASAGWSRSDVSQHLWETARMPVSRLRSAFATRAWSEWMEALPDGADAPMTDSAANINVVVVGGAGQALVRRTLVGYDPLGRGAGAVTVRMVRPDGIVVRPGVTLTAGVPSLEGLRVGVLSNNKPNAPLLLESIGHELVQRYGAVLGPVHVKNAAIPYSDQVLDGILKEVEIVLTGAGD